MSASTMILQIAERFNKDNIAEIIQSETAMISNEYAVSIIDIQHNDVWDIFIQRPDGSRISMQLFGSQGDLVPAVFRRQLRELIKLL